MFPKCFSRFLGAMMMLVCLAPSVTAQSAATGNVEGIVTDSSGGAIPNAQVQLKELNTGLARQARSAAA